MACAESRGHHDFLASRKRLVIFLFEYAYESLIFTGQFKHPDRLLRFFNMSSLRTLLRSMCSTSQGRPVSYHSHSSRPLPALFPCAEVPAQEHINLGVPTRPTLQRHCCSVRSSARDLVQYVLQGSKLGRKLRPKGEVAYLICCKVLLDLEVVLTCIWCCIVGWPMRVPPDLLPSKRYSDFLRKHLGDFPQGPTH